jgi:hypothetical protein
VLATRPRDARPGADALRLGAASGLALLLNVESGLAAAAAAAAYLWFRHALPALRDRLTPLGVRYLLGALLAVLPIFALVPLLLGRWLSPLDLPALVGNALATAGGGVSGWPLTADPWPLLMLAHAAFVLAAAALAGRALGPRAAYRASVAALVLVWFAYYANRPHPWNLSSYYLPYGLLFVDLVRWTSLELRRRRAGFGLLAALVLSAGVAAPNLTWAAGKGVRQVRDALARAGWAGPPAGARLVSGVFLPEPGATELEEKAILLRTRLAAGERPVFLSSDSYLVPKRLGRFAPLPVVDACWETATRARFEELLARVREAERVYLDAPGSTAHAASVCAVFYDVIRERLPPRFANRGRLGGWEVCERAEAR